MFEIPLTFHWRLRRQGKASGTGFPWAEPSLDRQKRQGGREEQLDGHEGSSVLFAEQYPLGLWGWGREALMASSTSGSRIGDTTAGASGFPRREATATATPVRRSFKCLEGYHEVRLR